MNAVGDVKQGSQSPRSNDDAVQDNSAEVDIFASVIEIRFQHPPAGALEWIE
jgi:hypothetical protein